MRKILWILVFIKIVYPFGIIKKGEILLSQKKAVVKEPVAFLVKERRIYVLDRRAANIKIYDRTGKLIKIFGRKGQGPDEFLNPVALASWQNLLMIYDMKKGKLFLYRIITKGGLQFYKSIRFYDFALHFKFLNPEELLISGHSQAKDGDKTYSVFKFNLKRRAYEYILPSFVCYGVKNEEEYERKFVEELRILSPENYVDNCGGEIYFASAVDFRILKRDKECRVKYFGRKSEKFKMPFVTKEMKRAVWWRQDAKLAELISKFSFVEGLFCTKKRRIILLFSSPAKEGRNIYLQIYNREGKFLKEYKLMHTEAETEGEILASFSEKKDEIFLLTVESKSDFGVDFKITAFRIVEQ